MRTSAASGRQRAREARRSGLDAVGVPQARCRCRCRRAQAPSCDWRGGWRIGRRGVAGRRRRPSRRGPWPPQCQHACPATRPRATPCQCGSTQQFTQPTRARVGGAGRPRHGDRSRTPLHFDANRCQCGAGFDATGIGTGIQPECAGIGASSVGCATAVDACDISTQRRSRLALMPLAIATAAIDTPACLLASTTRALNTSLWIRRRRPPVACSMVHTYPLSSELTP